MNYYIADCHFGHKNVLLHDNRPFADVEEMEEAMVQRWNQAVHRDDTVYILGDFCWSKADEWLRIVRRLKGKKVLIEGNHDLKKYPDELLEEVAEIVPYKEIVDQNKAGETRKVILCHYPIPFFKHDNNPDYYMLCGHVHTTRENDMLEKLVTELKQGTAAGRDHGGHTGNIYNVGCMMPWMDYTPRTLDEIVAWHAEKEVAL